MSTGLFELFKAVGSPAAVAGYLKGSSYDELIELDLESGQFSSLYHITKNTRCPWRRAPMRKSSPS